MKGSWIGGAVLLLFAACTANVFDLSVGDCFTDPGSGTVEDVEIVDCSEAHSFEVFANLMVPEDVELGDVEFFALDRCYDEFEPYVGIAYEDSAYEFSWLEPTQESWTERNDRTVNCLLFEDSESTGSARGSGR